jgi:hypothetical protein
MPRVFGGVTIIQNGCAPTSCGVKETCGTRFAKLAKIPLDHNIDIAEQDGVFDGGGPVFAVGHSVNRHVDRGVLGVGNSITDQMAVIGVFTFIQSNPVVIWNMCDEPVNFGAVVLNHGQKGDRAQVSMPPSSPPSLETCGVNVGIDVGLTVHKAAIAKEIRCAHAFRDQIC